MNIQKNFFRLKCFTFSNYKDVLNQAMSIAGVLLLIIQLFEIIKCLLARHTSSKLMAQNILIFMITLCINAYSLINKRNLLKLQEVNKNLTEINDKVRCFRHDFNNILQAIDGYIVLDDMDSLHTYFNSLVKECNYVNVVEFLNNKVKENPAISSVLLNKYRSAEKNNIKMNIDISIDLSKLHKKSYIISRMLGILLDNALEACIETDDKIINVEFIENKKEKNFLIKIENTYINKDIDIIKIFEKDYTTKVGNTGLGLWKIKDILKQDKNLNLCTTKDETMFKQELEIYT